jgi:hypothetical protein
MCTAIITGAGACEVQRPVTLPMCPIKSTCFRIFWVLGLMSLSFALTLCVFALFHRDDISRWQEARFRSQQRPIELEDLEAQNSEDEDPVPLYTIVVIAGETRLEEGSLECPPPYSARDLPPSYAKAMEAVDDQESGWSTVRYSAQ